MIPNIWHQEQIYMAKTEKSFTQLVVWFCIRKVSVPAFNHVFAFLANSRCDALCYSACVVCLHYVGHMWRDLECDDSHCGRRSTCEG